MDRDEMIDYLIEVGEAVEYGERWTGDTTHEWWWTDKDRTSRDYRMVATYHGTGARGDDDEAEYVRRLLDLGRAGIVSNPRNLPLEDLVRTMVRPEDTNLTHLIIDGKAVRFRNYFHTAAPEGRYDHGSPE